MVIVTPPKALPDDHPSLFLAGSIEMGVAAPWQTDIEIMLADVPGVLFNPRRDDWDSSWTQSITNPQFREQVEWELLAMEKADVVALYLQPGTKSPVSLLELGLLARTAKLVVVCCPEGFWRKGNVDIVCNRYGLVEFGVRHYWEAYIKGLIRGLGVKRLGRYD